MKELISVAILAFSLTGNTVQNKECIQFKTGTFEYTDPQYINWTVIRTDSSQMEVNPVLGVTLMSSLKWKSDCDYELIYTKAIGTDLNKLIGKKINVSITNVKGNKIMCSAKSEMFNSDTELIKIK